ncbi:methyltransferase domain-containing protein [Nocardia zapadnayensis]|nr:class I SAM-dependent methyltransferase [Nocardia zapadnayensis]MCX0274169.1 methyltransferase domain-containing protein [Nocardia zapadnayensis]
MKSDQRKRKPMFVDEPDTGLVISGLRRYNIVTSLYFFGRQRRLLTQFAVHSGVRSGSRALDIGCGPGKLVRELGRRVGPTGTVTGVDPSPEAVAHNQRHDPHHHYLRCTAQQLTLPDADFDVVTCTFVMHHIPEQHREAAIAEMRRVLRPGGRLLLADAHPSARLRTALAWLGRLRGKKSDGMSDTIDVRRYAAVLRENGFGEPEFVVAGYNTSLLLATRLPDRCAVSEPVSADVR